MSTLTDLFLSLSNKIRSKLGTTTKYTPAQAIAAIDNVYNKGVTDTKKGNAAVGDVKKGKTFTSVKGVNLTGTLTMSGTFTPKSGRAIYDMGEDHTYRYVDAKTVYDQGMVYYQRNRAGYIVVEGWARGEAYARQDIYDFRRNLRITFYGMRTDKNKKIRLVNATNGYVYYDSGYISSSSLTIFPSNTEDTIVLAVYLYSQTGDIQYANFSIVPNG